MNPSFTIIEHPADLGIEARGKTLNEAFEFSAQGLISIIIDTANVEAKMKESIRLKATDSTHLLVRWLNEVLYRYDGRHFVPKQFSISELSGNSLVGEIIGEHFRPSVHRTKLDVKAITYHQLLIREEADGFFIRVFLDI